jgi:hypothetical protein
MPYTCHSYKEISTLTSLMRARVAGHAIIAPPAIAGADMLGRVLAPGGLEGRTDGTITKLRARGGGSRLLIAHLGVVGNNVALLDALQSRQALEAVRALENARLPSQDVELSLQVATAKHDDATV